MSAFLGKMMIASGVVLLLACPLILLRVAPTVTMMISWGLFMAGLIAGVIYMNVSPRFKVRGDER